MMEWVSQHLIDISHYNGGFAINASYTMVVIVGMVVIWRAKKILHRRTS